MRERYELVRLLGRGAAGDVYLARDRLLGGQELALKRISARVDESLRRAFEREFATMAALSLPGVAQVHDFGVIEGDRPFYTRAYIEGRPLDQAAASASVAERVRLLCEVARVIAPLHRAGVVHGDIKPGNAIIDARGGAHVIDFGLARVTGHGPRERAAGGTLPFMAPELLRGEAPSVQSDVFALGVTLWLLVTSEFPFGRGGFIEGKEQLPEIPISSDALSRAVLDVARRALSQDPRDRLPTVDELIAALRECAPGSFGAATPRVFVAPRPRGHHELLGRLQTLVEGQGTDASAARTVVVHAPEGGGKSLLLRELKWRLQIRGAQLLVVEVDGGDVTTPLLTLARQLELALGDDANAKALAARAVQAASADRIDDALLSNALAEALSALRARGPVVLLVDDLDEAEAMCGAILRSAMFAEGAASALLVATASDPDAVALRRLGPSERIVIPMLGAQELHALVHDALGAVDASLLQALQEHTQGLPGALMDALASLSELPAPTAADVEKLPPLGASLSLAQARLARAPEAARELLALIAVLGRAQPVARLREALVAIAGQGDGLDESILRCEEAGLVARRPDGVGLRDVALEKALLRGLGDAGVQALAGRLLAARSGMPGLPSWQWGRLAVMAGDPSRMRELVPPAGEQLAAIGAHAAAAELYDALLPHSTGALHETTLLQLSRSRQALGELERAAELARALLARPNIAAPLAVDAAIVSAQALTALGRFEEAFAALSRIPADAEAHARARVQRELAKVHLRRVDYDAVREAAEAGLACTTDDAVRSELLCARGMAASYRADHEAARAFLEEAVALARAAKAPREEANALGALAITHYRTGDVLEARDLFAQCLEIARAMGDIGSMANCALNLGAMLFVLGEPGSAAEHYESAARLAMRAGRQSTIVLAKTNLAHLHIYFGLYERAKTEVAAVLKHAEEAGQRYIRAQATALLGDLAARGGDVERALIHYDDAVARYTELGQTREIAEHHLDAAEALLDRGGPSDASAAASRLHAARGPIERDALVDLDLRLQLLLSRTRLLSGEPEGALSVLSEVIERARKSRNRDVEWSALLASAQAHDLLGAEFAKRKSARLAVEVLEDIALRIPREHREAFWYDPRRRAARERALSYEERSHELAPESSGELATLMGDARAERLLDIIKRLASEHDLDRLLQRITECAVDLSGAERGYVLLVDGKGELERRVMEVAKSDQPDSHAAFSRSIAEAVLIDGEPIVTVDATRDGRLREYVSVHKLMLRSVACLPIRGRKGTVGVLYLEHRRSRGRFTESSLALLQAFADQAAIALENARLMAENQRRQAELEAANRELERAKDDLQELLSARTEALLEAQRELTEARRGARTRATRHGMVGRSPAMLRVFDTIDRVQGAKVPVIIQGESGTGKELVARAIHDAGPRARAPFIALNCGSVPESLLESELFGHVEGAFSGADRDRRGLVSRASGGTLFLDEVGDMPARMQVDLLRVLQEGTVCKVGGDQDEKVDVRFIAASHKPLEQLVSEGKFREDLYYRLNVVEIALPPLRTRKEDIALLCQHFLQLFAERDGQPEKRLTREALAKLNGHALPGNVRQLEHVLLQAVVLVEGPVIDADDLALDGERRSTPPMSEALEPMMVAPPDSLDGFRESEKRKILAALEAHGWNRARAAKSLGIPRRTFYRRLQEHRIL